MYQRIYNVYNYIITIAVTYGLNKPTRKYNSN